MTSISVDSISPSDAPPAFDVWKPAAPGSQVSGRIIYLSQYIKTNYKGDGREQVLRIDLEDAQGAKYTVYPVTNNQVNEAGDMVGWADRMAKAIGRAVRTAGAGAVDVGGWLTLRRDQDVETKGGMAYQYSAGYQVPEPGQVPVAVDQVAPAPAPAAPAPAPAAPAPAPAPAGDITQLV